MIVAMNLHILTPDNAPTGRRPVLEGIAADLGFVPNLAAATAASPTLLSAFDALRRTVSDETFDPVHREIAGVAVEAWSTTPTAARVPLHRARQARARR